MNNYIYAVIVIIIIGLLYALVLTRRVNEASRGSEKMMEIQTYIKLGSETFIRKQARILFVFSLIVFLVIGLFASNDDQLSNASSWLTAINFLMGPLIRFIRIYRP